MRTYARLSFLGLGLGLLPALLALGGCPLNINSNEIAVTYDPDPQRFAQDFGTQSGTIPDVPCAGNPSICSTVKAPAGTTAACDGGTGKCVIQAKLSASQTVTLANESGFPSSVANAAASRVEVRVMRYWTPENTLSFATPPIDVFIGAQGITDPSQGTKLGTLPALPAGQKTSCRAGTAGTKDSYCEMPLTDQGKTVLGQLAQNYKTPFTILVAGALTARGGQPMPSGKLEIFVQPQLTFSIPLK